MDDNSVIFRAMIEEWPTLVKFRFSLNQETDRGCVLLAASFLEFKLGELLGANLLDDNSLLENSGPLSTFSSRIKISYALGLISPQTQRDLDIIRRIRNDFAHDFELLTFESSTVRQRCDELVHHALCKNEGRRKRFIRTSMALFAVIHAKTITSAKPVSPNESMFLDKEFQERFQANEQKIREGGFEADFEAVFQMKAEQEPSKE